MRETQSFLIDIIKIVPVNTVCYIQAPSLDESEILRMLQPSEYNYYRQITLTPENKTELINIISSENIEEYFHNLEIKEDNLLVVQAHDGMEIGIISKSFKVPDWFVDKYVKTEMCLVSSEW